MRSFPIASRGCFSLASARQPPMGGWQLPPVPRPAGRAQRLSAGDRNGPCAMRASRFAIAFRDRPPPSKRKKKLISGRGASQPTPTADRKALRPCAPCSPPALLLF